MNDDTTHYDLRTDEGPNIAAMERELTQACDHAATAIESMAKNENTRYAKWADQQEDGREPDRVDGRPAKPWAGASDTRQRLADELIVADVRLMKKVTRTARLVVAGTEGGDFSNAGKVGIYVNHLRNIQMRTNVRRECEHAGQWRQTYGYSAMAITWRQKWTRDFDSVTIEQLNEMALQNPAVLTLLQLVAAQDSGSKRMAARLLQQMYEDLDTAEAYRQLQALRATGRMELPVRTLALNRPEWTALKFWRDLFGPPNMTDEQESPWLAWRVTLTAAQLEEKAFSEGDPEFIAAVRKTVGTTVLDSVAERISDQWQGMYRDTEEQMEGLHEVFYFYYEAVDDKGLPGKYRTVMSPHIKQAASDQPLYGTDGPLGYDHGLYPFVVMRRERPEREVMQTRGTPAIVHTNQLETKWQRDARINQTDLSLQPPVIRPEREIGLALAIRPMGEIGERRAQAMRFQSVPQVPAQSATLEDEARRDAMRYFARNRTEDPIGSGLADQDLVDDWCEDLEQCWRMTLQLAQQYEQERTFARTVGKVSVPFTLNREEIRGQHDLQLMFNASNLDVEQLKAKADIAQKVLLPMDRSGKIDWAPVVAGLFSHFFPEFADQAIRGDDQADAAEIKDEANNWGLILSGTEPEMQENGQNFQLRLQWLETKMKEPGAMARLAQLPDSQDLADRRLEHLRFIISQYTTQAQTGRVGVAPQPQTATA